jgi:hypothetical protein
VYRIFQDKAAVDAFLNDDRWKHDRETQQKVKKFLIKNLDSLISIK